MVLCLLMQACERDRETESVGSVFEQMGVSHFAAVFPLPDCTGDLYAAAVSSPCCVSCRIFTCVQISPGWFFCCYFLSSPFKVS